MIKDLDAYRKKHISKAAKTFTSAVSDLPYFPSDKDWEKFSKECGKSLAEIWMAAEKSGAQIMVKIIEKEMKPEG